MSRRRNQGNRSGTKNGRNTRDRILDVADDVFARYGYLAARLDDIAEEVGIRQPSLFHHFRNKEALYEAVLNRWLERQATFFESELSEEPDPSPEMELNLLTNATVEFLLDHPNFSYLALHTLSANRADGVPTGLSTISMDRWQDVLERGHKEGIFNDIGVAECMAVIGGVTTYYIAMPASQTGMINKIRDVERERLLNDIQRMLRSIVMSDLTD